MAKNIKSVIPHQKLGNIIFDLSTHDESLSNKIPNNILEDYKNADNQSFLSDLYVKYINDDKMTNIIGGLLENPNKLDKQDIIDFINSKYSSSSKSNKLESDTLSAGDHISINMYMPENPTESIYNCEVKIKQTPKHTLYAYIDNNFTHEDYRGLGLMNLGFAKLEEFLAQNDIYKVVLEAINLDGNQNLNKIYLSKGFEQKGDKFVKTIDQEMERF